MLDSLIDLDLSFKVEMDRTVLRGLNRLVVGSCSFLLSMVLTWNSQLPSNSYTNKSHRSQVSTSYGQGSYLKIHCQARIMNRDWLSCFYVNGRPWNLLKVCWTISVFPAIFTPPSMFKRHSMKYTACSMPIKLCSSWMVGQQQRWHSQASPPPLSLQMWAREFLIPFSVTTGSTPPYLAANMSGGLWFHSWQLQAAPPLSWYKCKWGGFLFCSQQL